jgi:paraquat-inducible protein B
VGGLDEGAPVVFRGVKIGRVKEIGFRFDPQKLSITIPVFIELEQRKKGVTREEIIDTYKQLIDRGLKAQLETQSILTGQLQVALDFYPDKPVKFVGIDPEYFEIPTVQSPLQELQKKVEKIPIDEIFKHVKSAVEGIEKIVNSPEVPEILHSINEAAKEIKPLAANLEEAVKDVRKLVQNVDNRIGPLASSIEGTVNDFGKLARNADSKIDTLSLGLGDTIKEIQKAVSSIEKTLGEAQLTLAEAKRTLSEDSTLSYEINETLQELQKGARSIRLLADDLKRRPESVLWGK